MSKKSKLLGDSSQLYPLELAFIEIRNYLDLMEDFLKTAKEKVDDSFKEHQQQEVHKSRTGTDMPDEFVQYELDSLIDQFVDISLWIPHNFRQSLLTSIIGFIEYELRAICEIHHQKFNTQKSITQIKSNSDFEKAKKYLSKVAQIDFNKLNPEWGFIKTLIKIRNKFVHHQGLIDSKDKHKGEIEIFTEQYDFLEIETVESGDKNTQSVYRLIITGNGMNDKLIKDAENFFRKLIDLLNLD